LNYPASVHNISENLIQVFSSICDASPCLEIKDDEIVAITKRIKMSSGVSLFNEILAIKASEKLEIPIIDVCKILKREIPEPQGFLGELKIINESLDFKSIKSKVAGYDYKLLKTSVRLNRLLQNEITEVEDQVSFFKAFDFLEEISETNLVGDIESTLIEALKNNTGIDLLFYKCPRLVQTTDKFGNHGLDVITHPFEESRGEKIYEGNENLLGNLQLISKKFEKLNIELRPMIVVVDSEIDDMFARDGSIVKTSDMDSAFKKCAVYSQYMNSFCEKSNINITTVLLSSIATQTEYSQIKKLTMVNAMPNHPEKGKTLSEINNVREKDFENDVAKQLESKRKVYGDLYTRDHAIHQAASRFGDMRGIAAVCAQFANPLIITRGPLPAKEAYLANHPDYKKSRRIIFADPERINLDNINNEL
jgi:hypothetical protein